MKNVLLIAGLLMVGCNDGKDSGPTGDTGSTGGTDETSASVSWGASGVTVTVSGNDDIAFFGMAETGASCDNGAGDCWTGEDCDGGYELSDGTLLQYCHPISGGSLTLSYGGAFDNLAEGSATVFAAAENDAGVSFDGSVTYYLETTSAECYVWGHNPGYYSGCTEL